MTFKDLKQQADEGDRREQTPQSGIPGGPGYRKPETLKQHNDLLYMRFLQQLYPSYFKSPAPDPAGIQGLR